MNRLQKFVERSEDGKPTGRVAYVLKPELLDTPVRGKQWHADPSFNAAEAVLKDASLKDTYRSAIAEGIALVVTGSR
jgi:hypothetical protein